jgi:hypothetical protein
MSQSEVMEAGNIVPSRTTGGTLMTPVYQLENYSMGRI